MLLLIFPNSLSAIVLNIQEAPNFPRIDQHKDEDEMNNLKISSNVTTMNRNKCIHTKKQSTQFFYSCLNLLGEDGNGRT